MAGCGPHGGSADQHGAGASPGHRPDTVADLLEQLQREHNDTLEHEHLALTEIHHLVGHEQLFDTLFVYENYPVDTAALLGNSGLTVSAFTSREYNHYPLSVTAIPETALGLRVEFDTSVRHPT